MKVKALVVAVPLLLAPLSAHAVVELGAKGAYWFPKLSGDLEIGDIRGDVKDELGFSNENVPMGEVFFRAGSHHLTLGAARFDYSGKTAELGKTSLEYTMIDLAYQWDLINLDNKLGGFSLGPILAVKYVEGDLEAEVDDGELIHVRAKENFKAPLPMVGLGAHVGILANYVEARARGVGMSYRGSSILDLSAELAFHPIPFVELTGGYRYIAVDVKGEDLTGGEGDLRLDFTQSGPYLGLLVKLDL